MSKFVKELHKTIIPSFFLGLGLGFSIDFLIIPALSLPSIFLHILTGVMCLVFAIVYYQYLKTIEWEIISQSLTDE